MKNKERNNFRITHNDELCSQRVSYRGCHVVSVPSGGECSLFVGKMRQELSIAIIGNHVQSRPVLRITNYRILDASGIFRTRYAIAKQSGTAITAAIPNLSKGSRLIPFSATARKTTIGIWIT